MLVNAGRNGRDAYEKYFRWEHQRANLIALYRYLSGEKDITPCRYRDWRYLIGNVSS